MHVVTFSCFLICRRALVLQTIYITNKDQSVTNIQYMHVQTLTTSNINTFKIIYPYILYTVNIPLFMVYVSQHYTIVNSQYPKLYSLYRGKLWNMVCVLLIIKLAIAMAQTRACHFFRFTWRIINPIVRRVVNLPLIDTKTPVHHNSASAALHVSC